MRFVVHAHLTFANRLFFSDKIALLGNNYLTWTDSALFKTTIAVQQEYIMRKK